MIVFTLFGVLLAVAVGLTALFVVTVKTSGMVTRYPEGETWTRWPLWLPHRHDWRRRLGSVGAGGEEWHETCMRCRRQRQTEKDR